MKITHRRVTADAPERLRRQAAIHRKCLLLIRANSEQASAARKTG